MTDLAFNFHDEVVIKDIATHGFVDQVLLSVRGTQYKVIYFINGEQKEAWCLATQLRLKHP